MMPPFPFRGWQGNLTFLFHFLAADINLLSKAVRRFHPDNHIGAVEGRGQAPPSYVAAQHSSAPRGAAPSLPPELAFDDKFPAMTVGSEDRPLAQFAVSPFRVFGRPGRPEDGSGSEDVANPLNVVFHGGSDGAHAKFNLGAIGELFPPPAHLDKRDARADVKEVVMRDPRHVTSFVIPVHRRDTRSVRGGADRNEVQFHDDDDLKEFHRSLLREADDLRTLMENIEQEIHVMEHRDKINAITPDDITSDGFPAPASLCRRTPTSARSECGGPTSRSWRRSACAVNDCWTRRRGWSSSRRRKVGTARGGSGN